MLIHYLSFAIRLLRRSRMYSAITIGGLAVALASLILIVLFVRHELGYDEWLPGVDRLYRIQTRFVSPGREANLSALALGGLKAELADDPDVVAIARMVPNQRTMIEHDGRVVYDTVMSCDPSLFDVLDLPVVRGERTLSDPHTILLTQTAARTYFGDADPIGRTLTVRGLPTTPVLRVGGVLRDLPSQTHLELGIVSRIDALASTDYYQWIDGWENISSLTYLRLRSSDPAAIARVERHIATLLATRVTDIEEGDTRIRGADLFSARLVPVRDLHLHETSTFDVMRPHGDATALYAISGVAALLLLIAIGNFLNLATARAGRRAREIAIRKASGAEPRDIIVQYLGEAVLIALSALVLALAIVELALPWFEQLAGRALAPPYDPPLLAALVVGTVVLGLVSGIYPAIVLSRYEPATVMNQSQPSVASGSGRLRAALVFAQFAAAIALAIGTSVVYRQERYASSVDLGFAKHDRLVVTGIFNEVRTNIRPWVEQVQRIPGVERVGLALSSPAGDDGHNTVVQVPGDAEHSGLLHAGYVDPDYFATLAVEPLVGRAFSRDVPSDDSSSLATAPQREFGVVLNAAAVRRLGLGTPQQAVGRALQIGIGAHMLAPARVLGVVPDLHAETVRRPVDPTVFAFNANWFSTAIIQFRPGTGDEVRRAVEARWTAMFPDHPFSAELLETRVDAQYRNERRLAAILTAAALLALAVACLGLYGLSSFLIESRSKEIAIRKVLGASTSDVISLLAWQLARPVALACAVAVPVAYLASERWLGGFAYRISVGAGWLTGTVAVALAIAAATVALQSLRSALAAPVDALRG